MRAQESRASRPVSSPLALPAFRVIAVFAAMVVAPAMAAALAVAADDLPAAGPLAGPPSQEPEEAAESVAEELPDASELVAGHVAAIGGEEALRGVVGRHASGSFGMPAQGVSGSVEIWEEPPSRQVVVIELPGVGTVQTGYDGEVGWMLNPATGPMLLEGRMLDQTRQEAWFYGPLETDEFIASRQTVELTEFEGEPAYKVKVTTTWGEEYDEFYRPESGLLAGSVRTVSSPMGDVPSTSVLAEYGEFDGVLYATRVVQRAMGMDQVLTIDSVEHGDVDDAVFERPAEIEALLEPAES